MLFCNLTPRDGSFVNAIVFCRKSEFCEYITSLHIQHSIYVRQFEFFVFTMKQIASLFCNFSFAGHWPVHLFQKSKRFELIDKFNDTSRYLDDIFTIDNPAFAEHIPDIYSREIQLNKANTSDTETSFLDINIKGIGDYIQTSVYDKREDFGFPIVNFHWLSSDVPRLPSYGIYIS